MTRTLLQGSVLGIDPGKSGGLALFDSGRLYQFWKMPETERDLWDVLGDARDVTNCAVIELVRSSPQMGVVSAFTFGRGLGSLRMGLIGHGFVFEEVSPVRWQTDMRCRTKGDKNVSKRRAQELYPSTKVTHAIADALLIATWGARFSLLLGRRASKVSRVPLVE